MNTIIERVAKAVEYLTPPRDKYTDIVFVLRGIRESYRITQKEMAALLQVTQSMISKFESLRLDASLDFFISYAFVLGYKIAVKKVTDGDEITRFNERQAKIAEEIPGYDLNRIEEVYFSLPHRNIGVPESILDEGRQRIIKSLIDARDLINYKTILSGYTSAQEYRRYLSYQESEDHDMLTSKRLSNMIGVSKKTIQRFNGYKASLPSIFKYACVLNMELRLEVSLDSPSESLGAFYIRNCIALHQAIHRQNAKR